MIVLVTHIVRSRKRSTLQRYDHQVVRFRAFVSDRSWRGGDRWRIVLFNAPQHGFRMDSARRRRRGLEQLRRLKQLCGLNEPSVQDADNHDVDGRYVHEHHQEHYTLKLHLHGAEVLGRGLYLIAAAGAQCR